MRSFNVNFSLNYQIIYIFANLNIFAICCFLKFAFNLSLELLHKLDIVFRKSSYTNVEKYNIFLLCQLFIIDLLLIRLTIFCLFNFSKSKEDCRRIFF